jgi:hypothetical protein
MAATMMLPGFDCGAGLAPCSAQQAPAKAIPRCSADGPFPMPRDDEAQVKFDTLGVASEMYELWEDVQNRQRAASGANGQWPQGGRQVVVHIVMQMVGKLGVVKTLWFDAVTLLDCYVQRRAGVLETWKFPKLCEISIRTLCKLQGFDLHTSHRQDLEQTVRNWTMQLQAMNVEEARDLVHVADEDQTLELRGLEKDLLRVMDWQLQRPTLEGYLTMFSSRLNELSCGYLQPSVNWVWFHSMAVACAVLMRQSAAEGPSPRKLAAGIFVLNIAAARLLPVETLKPADLGEEEWSAMYVGCEVFGRPQSCYFPAAASERLLEALESAMAWSLEDLREACGTTAALLQEMRADQASPAEVGAP